MAIKIRRAHYEETSTLSEIALAAKRHWDYPEEWIQKWAPLLTFTPQQIKDADVFAAVVDSELVGFYRLFTRKPRATLEDLWIRPDFIGKGIGHVLFEHAVTRCHVAGVDILEVEADPHAQGFYEKMGMHKVGEHPSDVDGQRNLPMMELKL